MVENIQTRPDPDTGIQVTVRTTRPVCKGGVTHSATVYGPEIGAVLSAIGSVLNIDKWKSKTAKRSGARAGS